MARTNVAVVGGGIYGITAALKLDEAGHDVVLYEKEDDIMKAASGINQWRLHRGYHYPRSDGTARSCLQGEPKFREMFSEAVISSDDHHYCIAAERTKTTPREFLEHCEWHGLEYEEVDIDVVDSNMVDLELSVRESRVNPYQLKRTCWDRLERSDVTVELETPVTLADDTLDAFDYVIVAAYAGTNEAVDGLTSLRRELKYQTVEKPVVELPSEFTGQSVVIMDGPFMCFDPYGRTGEFLLGNVVHSVHHTNVGLEPEYDDVFEPLLNDGVVQDPPVTNIDAFRRTGAEFMPGLSDARHVGSMYTVRTVLPDKEDTDARPTIIRQSNDFLQVLAGKFVNCVDAADEIVRRIDGD